MACASRTTHPCPRVGIFAVPGSAYMMTRSKSQPSRALLVSWTRRAGCLYSCQGNCSTDSSRIVCCRTVAWRQVARVTAAHLTEVCSSAASRSRPCPHSTPERAATQRTLEQKQSHQNAAPGRVTSYLVWVRSHVYHCCSAAYSQKVVQLPGLCSNSESNGGGPAWGGRISSSRCC